jgi:hypothetical protein
MAAITVEVPEVTSAQKILEKSQVKPLEDGWSGIPTEELQKAISSGLDNSDVSQSLRVMAEKMNVNAADPNEKLSQKFCNVVKGVRAQVEDFYVYMKEPALSKEVSMRKLLEIQLKVMQMTVLIDVSSKISDKSGQAFQTLFRNQ